jgi:hypothetical protein
MLKLVWQAQALFRESQVNLLMKLLSNMDILALKKNGFLD